jgi:8-oxo-dGTP pyrophosphatase MutT (NUDIX family)
MGQLQPKSPILRHAQTALTSPVNAQLEQKARNLQNSLVWSYLFNAPKSHSALTGAGLASALTNWGMPANAYAGAALGSVLGAAPAAGMLELGQKGRHGLMGKALGLSTLAGYRKSKLPSWLANILGLVEPSILEAAQAGRDLRRAVPSGAVAQRVKQLANMPLREAIHRDMGRFSRLLNYVWPMRKLASFSRRDIFKNLLKGFVKNEPPLISAVPGVAAATEAINKTAPQFTRREFSKFMGLTAASAPRVFNYLARPPFTMVRTLTKNPFLPMKMADSPFLNFVNWVNRKIMGKPMKGPYDLSVGPGLRYNLFKESAAELPYRDRSELIARLKDKVLAMEYAHGGIGFYGGGIDPGENPTDAAAREFFEESGRKAKNVRPAGVPPVTLEWTPEMIEENPKLKARAGQFRGSRTHYFVGDVAGRKRHHEKDLDTTTSTSSKPVWLTPEEAISRIEGYGGVDDTTKVLAQQRKDISAARMQILRQILSERQAKAASMSSDGKPEEHVKSALTAGRIRYWANKLGILQVPWSDWKYGTKMLMKAEHAKRTAGAAAGDVYLRRAGLPTSAEMDKLRKMYLRFYRHPEEAIRRKELQYYVDRPGVWKTLRMMEGGGGEVAPIIREIAERRKFKPPTPQQLRNYEFMVTTPPGGKPIGRVGEDSSVPGRFLVADRLAFERRRDELIDKLNRLDMKITDPWVSASARTKFSRMKRELDAKFRELTGKGTRVVHTHPPFSDPLHFIFYENWMRALPSGLTPDKKFSYNKAQQYIEQARKGIQRPTSDLRIMSTSPAQVAVPIAVVPGNLQAGIKVIPGSTSRWAKKRKEPVLKRIFFREGPEKIYPPYRSRGKQASADFAPGLPDRSRFGDVTKLPKEQALKFVIQEHLAQRSGRHYDVRMGTPDTGLYSWATKKEWPGPGGKIMLFQQPVHRYEYGDFQGRIPKGYGKGIVKTHDKGAILVTHAADNKIKFIVAHRGTPEYYTLIRRSGPPENPRTERQRHSQGGQWLLINTTPTDVKKWIGLDPKDMAKLRYKSIPAKDVEKLFTQGNIIQNKVDGASMLYRLLNDHIEATSYRVSKEGRPIVHTQRLFGPGGMKVNIPKEHVGTVLRGEAYGTREGKAIPPQELGGILNASLIHSLEKQRANNVQMKSMLFDVAGEQDKPYAERLSKLESITKLLPQEHFHLPESAKTPEEARALWETISGGKHPLTREGVVAWPPQGVPTKAKLMPESDVWIRNVFPGEGKYKGSGAGGVEYSLSPEGEVVGRIGTGFSDEMRRDMIQHPERYVGRLARIGSQEQFPSGAHRAPAFLALHEDYPTKVAQLDQVKEAGQALRAIWKGLSSVVRPSPGIPKLNVAPGPFYSQRLHAAVRMPELYHGLSQKGFKVVRQRIKEPTSIAGHIQAGRTGLPDDVLGMQVYARGLGDVEQALQTLRQLGVRRISSKAFVKPTYHGINVKGMYRGIPMELQLSPGRLANFGQIALHSLSYKPRAVLGGLDKLIAGKILPWFSGSSWMSKSLPQLQKMMPIKTASEHALAGATVLLESLALANTMRERRKKLKTMHRKKSSLIGEVKRRALAYGD